MKKIKVILIGAGARGIGYTDIMSEKPEQFEVVAVAEPIENRRDHVKNKHHIPDAYCFSDYKELLKLGKIADLAIIGTMDRMHFEPAMEAIRLHYDLLLEKPIAPTAEECLEITRAAKEQGVKVVICTVLRYTPVFCTIKDLIDSGKIGRVMSVNHEEGVGNTHQSHSFVRGNWGNSHRSSAMLLQKSCHDLDILEWLIGKKCKKIQSFGRLSYFKAENTPQGAPEYCIEGCPVGDTCPYNAKKLYLDQGATYWFRSTATREVAPTDESVKKAISTTQYGKCVYKCDNDVVDHQTVNMLFEDDVTVTFSMNAFNKGGRQIHIMGTEGELYAHLEGNRPIHLYTFADRTETDVEPNLRSNFTGGHSGGDQGIVEDLYDYLAGTYHGKSIPDIEESCYNHMLVFAAERSRAENTVVDVAEYIRSVGADWLKE